MPLPTSVEGASEGTAESDAVRMSRRRSSIDEGALSRQTSNSRLLDGDPDYSARTMRRRSSVDDGTMSGSQRSLVTGNDGGTSPNPLHDSTVTTAADALRMARLVGFSESSLVESTETLLPPTGGGGSPWRPAGNPPDRRPNAARRRSDESEMSTMTRPPPPSQPRRQSDGAPVQRRRSSVDEGAISRQNSRSRLLDGDDGQPSRTARRRSSVADDGSLSREGSRRNLMQGLDGGDDSDQSLLVMRRVVAEARRRRASEDGGDGEEEEDRSPSPTSDPPGDADQAGLLSMEDLLQSIQDDIRPKDESAAGNPAAPRAPPTRGEYLSDRIAQIKQTMQSEYRGSVQSEHTSYSGYSEIDDEESSVTDNGSDGRGGGADADSPRRDRASTDADETTGSAHGGDELDVSQRDESVATDAPEGIAAEEDDEDEGKDAEDEEEVEPAAEPGEDEAEDESPPPPPAPPAEKVKLSFGSGLNIDLSAITTLKAAKPSSRKSDPKPEDVPKPSRREEAKKVDPKTTIADIKTFETTNLPFTGSLGESGMYTGSVSGQYKPHGKGTMVYDNGDVIRGYWAEGDLVRESEMYSDSDDDDDDDDDDGEEDLMGSMANVATRSRSKSRDAGRSRSRDRRPAEAPPPPKPRTPRPPPPEFKIGDRGERKDMIVDKDEALKMIDHLQFGDGAFIRRSDGKWTYAVVKSFEDTQEGRNAIRFIVNDRNSSKSYAKKYWESHVRPLKGMKIPEPEKPAAAERGREKQRDGQADAPSHDPAAADDRGTSCPPVTQSRFNFEVPGRRGRSRSHSKRRAVSASPMRILTSIVESEAEDEDDDDDGHTGSESTMQ
ncbi:hypothetical protein THAOC_06223 [Thalassiosira oceanica]|uniref:Uncharacterized protein n=1 Tax=Thalassiosira oceanica TaxID=159749 RepID=K0T0X2_THAOC|nr:hypothetical protein THAOC_06223 [Thalassiosira oceanica]|eukprot:EJK72258.1 hypothetical protein THAOC_06223 [Thalassiosira oceanica]